MANIPVGLIGCGGRGRGHIRALQALADVELGRRLRPGCGKPRTGGC